MLTFLGIIVLVIFVHEMGHYLAARAMGVAVDSFSIGFGKVLLKKKLWGTEWRLSLIPFGGYIMPRGEQDYNNEKNDPKSFWAAAPWRRGVIAVMGPVFNLLLPWPLYFMLLVGQPFPDVVVPDGIAFGALLRSGSPPRGGPGTASRNKQIQLGLAARAVLSIYQNKRPLGLLFLLATTAAV